MKFCPRCGAESQAEAAFCSKCGQSFAGPIAPMMPLQAPPPAQSRYPKKKGNPIVGGVISIAVIYALFKGCNSIVNSKPTPIARSVSGGSSSDRQETNYEPPRHKHVVFKKSGTGISTTERFDVSDDWDLEWAYNCSNFSDGSGNSRSTSTRMAQ